MCLHRHACSRAESSREDLASSANMCRYNRSHSSEFSPTLLPALSPPKQGPPRHGPGLHLSRLPQAQTRTLRERPQAPTTLQAARTATDGGFQVSSRDGREGGKEGEEKVFGKKCINLLEYYVVSFSSSLSIFSLLSPKTAAPSTPKSSTAPSRTSRPPSPSLPPALPPALPPPLPPPRNNQI
jgi:hypothetical protein